MWGPRPVASSTQGCTPLRGAKFSNFYISVKWRKQTLAPSHLTNPVGAPSWREALWPKREAHPNAWPQRWLLPADISSGCPAASQGLSYPLWLCPAEEAASDRQVVQRSCSQGHPARGRAVEKVLERDGLRFQQVPTGVAQASAAKMAALAVPMPPPTFFSSYRFYCKGGRPSPLLLYIILDPIHLFLPFKHPPLPSTCPHCWQGLARALSSPKTQCRCFCHGFNQNKIIVWLNRKDFRKPKLENHQLSPYPAVNSSLLKKKTHTASLTQNKGIGLSTQTWVKHQKISIVTL